MEHTSLSDALISLIPTYGPWIIFGIVALESAGVPFPGETILVAAALLAASTGSDQHRRRRTGGRSGCDRRGRYRILGRMADWFALSSQIRSLHPPRWQSIADLPISFSSVWERRRILWAFHCGAANAFGFACGLA